MDAAAVAERVDETERVLLLEPTLAREGTGGACERLMAPGTADPGLYISLVRPVADILDAWRECGETTPLGIVTIRSRSPGAGEAADPAVRTEVVSDPGDLTGMGIAVTECLDALPPGPRVCLDSLTVLLQYVDVERAFRFLHVLSRYLADADGSLHVHLDPAAGDEAAVATLASVFDVVARHEDGDWSVAR